MRAPEPGAGWTPARQRGVNGRGPLHSERLWQSRGGPLRGMKSRSRREGRVSAMGRLLPSFIASP